jgi:DNA-binding LytR/AlgR family response regulator
MYTALVVDDEPLARDGLARMVARLPRWTVAGTCATARAAVERCLALAPDALLLDVEMPEHNGFALLAALPPGAAPFVILVTAFEQYALPAFSHAVRDYVLKPVDPRRLEAALARAAAAADERRHAALGRDVRTLTGADASHGGADAGGHARLVVRDAGRVRVIALDAIDALEGDGYYTRVHSEGRTYLLRESLSSLARRLPPPFARVHRSVIVHLRRVAQIRKRPGTGFVATLTTGRQFTVSRRRWTAVRAALRALEPGGEAAG